MPMPPPSPHTETPMPRLLALCPVLVLALASRAAAQPSPHTPRVGPPRGTVMVVGGGTQGPELYAKFIELAGGPDALIIDVPTAGGDSTYPADWRGTRGLRSAGARHVVVLHPVDRKGACSAAVAPPPPRAAG